MHSFQKPTSDGWRWSPGWRTRREATGWIVQRWATDHWLTVQKHLATYAEAREVPERWRGL